MTTSSARVRLIKNNYNSFSFKVMLVVLLTITLIITKSWAHIDNFFAEAVNNNKLLKQFFISGSDTLSLGNLVWNDRNSDGNKGADEPGIGGVTIKLYTDNNGDHYPDAMAVQTSVTAGNGTYSFHNLAPGKYIVGIILPASYRYGAAITAEGANPDNNIDNDNNGVVHIGSNIAGSEERTNTITLSAGDEPTTDGDDSNSNQTLDLALLATGGLGNLVWNDVNKNGLQDYNEPGLPNATVILTLPDNTSLTTLTSPYGYYSFTNLGPANYTIKFISPDGMRPSPSHAGSDETRDSDPSGESMTYDLPPGQTNNSFDAGFYQADPCTQSAGNVDGDCSPNLDDIDDDNDGILDIVESGGYDPLKDCDGDGIANYKDPTPGCTVPSGYDLYGKPFSTMTWSDCNGDGINDFFDWDRDGIINELDLDSDNDGIVDIQETRDNKRTDINNDGMTDGVDLDEDGLFSGADENDHLAGGKGLTPEDLDKDGTPNYLDLDSDGDGLADNREALELDAEGTVYFGLTMGMNDDDNDGVRTVNYTKNENDADNIKGFGAKGIVLKDNDNDGFPNSYDIDTDDDGITDNVEGQPTCSERQPLGTDADGDGLDDTYDVDNNICLRRAAGITPYDKDFDGTPDIRDLDTDNDTAPDVYEGSGEYGNFVTKRGDADQDGLMDEFDIFDIRTATGNFTANVVHGAMGFNGSFDGPEIAGSQAKLPGFACPSDRDWRNVAILPVTMLSFKGNLNAADVKLSWKTVNEMDMSHYLIERSLDGRTFTEVGKVMAKGSSVETVYNFTDDVSGLATAERSIGFNEDVNNLYKVNLYYRLRQADKNGNSKLSSILVFAVSSRTSKSLAISPNPARSFFNIKINAAQEGFASIRITDMLGKVIMIQNSRMSAGTNAISFTDLQKFSSGTYMVQVSLNGKVFNQKLLVVR